MEEVTSPDAPIAEAAPIAGAPHSPLATAAEFASQRKVMDTDPSKSPVKLPAPERSRSTQTQQIQQRPDDITGTAAST